MVVITIVQAMVREVMVNEMLRSYFAVVPLPILVLISQSRNFILSTKLAVKSLQRGSRQRLTAPLTETA